MTSIEIPTSIEGARERLTDLDLLIHVSEWGRAAIVAAFVRLPGRGGDRRSGSKVRGRTFETPDVFAAREIPGLRREATVRMYVQRWLDANGGEYPTPGKRVTLPAESWEPTRSGTDGYNSDEGAQATIERLIEKHGPGVIAGAVRRPEVARAVVNDFEASTEVIRQSHADTPDGAPLPSRGGGVVGELGKLLIQIGAMGYEDFGRKFHEHVRDHVKNRTAWKPKEEQAVLKAAQAGVQYGKNVIDLLTPVTDEAIQDLLSKG